MLRDARGDSGTSVKAYRADREAFLEDLLATGVLEAMAEEANRRAHWTDVLVERLRSGRGSAISGQKRGRGVEDFAEAIVTKVFGGDFQARCTFQGPRGQEAKCDFAIPSKSAARILIESKGYGATGSKMTDILGDIRTIIAAKRPDTALFFTDGLTWKQRQSDLRKIVEFQNAGDITRIYTFAMAKQFEKDLRELKAEYRL
ncbi:MAG TPA: DpnII family type II restriction endonuclease [Bryobacteraceae bacterium]|nr:DpnII family type II restriction endonuclease [Bryobacteraceae bacterium]